MGMLSLIPIFKETIHRNSQMIEIIHKVYPMEQKITRPETEITYQVYN
jgi:hypothetical protein